MKRWAWLAAGVLLAVVVAIQVMASAGHSGRFVAAADVPVVAPGVDVLAGIAEIPQRIRGNDYRRAAFGDSWTDDNTAPGGHNGCDTRNDILDRDLVDKTYVSIKPVPQRGSHRHAARPVHQRNHRLHARQQDGRGGADRPLVPLAYAWDQGARNWTDEMRVRFANDPANLLAVDGPINEDKSDGQPAVWMPPNHAFWCQYAVQFAEVLRGYGLPIDQPSAVVLREAAATCPAA